MVDLGGYVIILVETKEKKVKLYGERNQRIKYTRTYSGQLHLGKHAFMRFVIDDKHDEVEVALARSFFIRFGSFDTLARLGARETYRDCEFVTLLLFPIRLCEC